MGRERTTGGNTLPPPFRFLVAWVGVWVARHQASQIEYLKTVNRVLVDVGRNTIKRILKEHGIDPAALRRRQYSWATFIKAHLSAITAADFFTVEVLNWAGLVRYHVFFVIDLASRRVEIAGIWRTPDGLWMEQSGSQPPRRR